MNNLNISWVSLLLAGLLVVVSLVISESQKLHLAKDTIIAVSRAIIQLIIVGFILQYIFQANLWLLTVALYLVILFNAAWATTKRSMQPKVKSFLVSVIALLVSITPTIVVLVITGAIKFSPSQIIPITGMIATNAMTTIGLSFRQLDQLFVERQENILEKFSLGATISQASQDVYQQALKTSMQPQIDSAKTLGLVSLPGMMTGLMFAGVEPTNAIKYQIMVTFMLLGATGISALFATSMMRNLYFNKDSQLILPTK